jgi:hypothetical protein
LPEWLVERGIGETRSVLVESGEIVEARIRLEGVARAGTSRQAVLKSTGTPAVAADGAQEYLLPKGAPGATEGQTIAIEITREAIPGPEPWKRPLARLADSIAIPLSDGEVIAFPSPLDRLSELGWLDLIEEARSGIVRFDGGELRVSPTPAMTLIDVDGRLPPFELAMAGARAAARAIRRHGIGGSIGIDLPTVGGKAQRQAIADAVDVLLPQPFERTSVNGFGFLQIVQPRTHASTFELAADRAPFETRALLRRAAFEAAGSKRLAAHPAVIAVLERNPDWLDQLAGQIGGPVSLRADPALPMSGGHAEPA